MNLSVTPLQLNLSLYAGDDVSIVFTWADKTTGDPYPLTGTFAAHILDANEFKGEFTVDLSRLAEGVVLLSLTGDQVRALIQLDAPTWDLQQTDANGRVRTWYRGDISVALDVTDRPVVTPLAALAPS